MTANLKRLVALAIAQCGSFVVVLIIGVVGGPGHQVPQHPPTHTPTARHSTITTPASGRTSTKGPSSHASSPSARASSPTRPATSTSGRNPRQGSH